MSETAVQIESCPACEADIREGAEFCYNCGGPLTESAEEKVKEALESAPDLPDENDGTDASLDDKSDKAKKAVESEGVPKVRKRKRPYKRKPSKRIPPEKLEVVWNETSQAPNIRFILLSVGVILFSLILFLLAMYLK